MRYYAIVSIAYVSAFGNRNLEMILLENRKSTDPVYFHIDVNNAFLSWEALYQMEELGSTEDIREQDAIIGGDISTRHGVVLAKSQSAKKYGIQTGEAVISAMKKCPGLVRYTPHHEYYKKQSGKLMELFRTYAPVVDQYSIDEAFLDMSGTYSLYGDPVTFAYRLKDEIRDTLGFTVNIGISSNRLLAKMASDFTKPDRVHTLFPDEIQEKMWPLPISSLFMAGHASVAVLQKLEIRTIGDLAQMDPAILTLHLKSHGKMLWEYANGVDNSALESEPSQAKGIGNSTTLASDLTTAQEAYPILLQLSTKVGKRLEKAGQSANNLCVEIKYATFEKYTRQMPLSTPTQSGKKLYHTACHLFDTLWNGNPIRLLGVRAGKLTDVDEPVQLDLFTYDPKAIEKEQKMERAMDKIREKFGKDLLQKGIH